MKKVLIYMNNLAGGGAERTVVNLINNMDSNYFKPILVLGSTDHNDYLPRLRKDIYIDYIGDNSTTFKKVIQLIAKIKEHNPDLLFSTMINNNLILLMADLLMLNKYKSVVRVANYRSINNQVGFPKKVLVFFLYNFVAKKIVALSKGVKDDLIQNFRIRRKKVEVIYNPIDLVSIRNSTREMVEDYNFGSGYTLIAVGRLVEQKDYPTLIKAFNQVVSTIDDVNLIILGKGPMRSTITSLVEEFGLQDKVKLLGFKENPYKYIARSDLFILSSIHEGFGHVIAEALACGTPVISTDCKSGPSEIILNNKFGALVPVGNHQVLAESILSLLFDQEKKNNLSINGKERANDYDAAKITREYERLFSELGNARPSLFQ